MSFDQDTFDRAFPNGKKNKKSYESKLHEQICNYLRLQYPKVRFISSLTGEYNSNSFTNARNSRIQHSPGQPDLFIVEKRNGFSGLALELKTLSSNPFKKNGELRSNVHLRQQDDWLTYLRVQGWSAHFAIGFDHAKELIDKYMK